MSHKEYLRNKEIGLGMVSSIFHYENKEYEDAYVRDER